eukprot:1706968-Pyramimonas_sp.AAC.1
MDPEVRPMVTRCFDAKVKATIDGEQEDAAKWKFAAMVHTAVTTMSMYALKTNGVLKSASSVREEDEAP